LLVTQFAAYAQYQQGRGSNTAWTWEHQAMTRARWVAGPDHLAQQFEGIRLAVITAPRSGEQLSHEIVDMRTKVSAAHSLATDRFDFKHSAGGMMDAEFMVQYLVLQHAHQHPALQRNSGNIELLRQAEQAGLIAAPLGQAAAQAYEHLRQLQHRARLDEAAPHANISHMQNDMMPILTLWQALFGANH
jgi:glutamate-ammonia-ligase adenylyltransferase